MKNKFKFSGRARKKLQGLYFIWVKQAIATFDNPKNKGALIRIRNDWDAVKTKKKVPNVIFSRFLRFVKANYSLEQENLARELLQLILILAEKNVPSDNSFARAFQYDDPNHDFVAFPEKSNSSKEKDIGKPGAQFYCLVLTGMELDEFQESGEVNGLRYDQDILELSESEEVTGNKFKRVSSRFSGTHFLTQVPALDFGTEIIERRGEIKLLSQLIEKGNNRIQLFGIGGTGKSLLAQTFVNNTSGNWDHIIWIEQSQSIISSFTSHAPLRESLDIQLFEQESDEELFARMMLRLGKKKGRNLLIIDDTNEDILKPECGRYLPSTENWTLLVTARGPLEGFSHLEVDAMVPAEALKLFRIYFTRAITHDTEKDLLKEVEYHPLTIEVMAKTLMASPHLSPDEMLNRFQKLELDALKEIPGGRKDGKEARLFSYLITTFELIEENFDSFSLEILRYFSISIPQLSLIQDLRFLFGIQPDKFHVFDGVLLELFRSGWIRLFSRTASVQIHRMIRDMLYYQLKPGVADLEPFIQRLVKVIGEIGEKKYPVEVFKWAPYGEHLTLLMRGNKHPLLEQLNQEFINLLGFKGDTERAIEYKKFQLEEFLQEFGEKSTRVCQIRSELGSLYLQMGDFNASIYELELAIKSQVQLFGDLDIRVFTDKIELGAALIMGDREWEAKNQLEALKPVLQEEWGGDHHLVQVLNLRLGEAYEVAGMMKEAKALYEEIIQHDKKFYPAYHHHLAMGLTQFGLVKAQLGEIENAQQILEEVLEIEIKNYGEVHPNVASCYSNMGLVAYKGGNLNLAMSYYDKAIEIDEEFYSDDHPYLIVPLSQKGTIYLDVGKVDLAEKLFLQALKLANIFFPPNHRINLDCHKDLASLYLDQGRIKEGTKILFEIMEQAKKSYGLKNPITASIQIQVAEVYKLKGMYTIAVSHLREALDSYINIYGDQNPKTSVVMGNLGNILLSTGETDEALKYLRKSYEITGSILGEELFDHIGSMSDLATVLEEVGEFEKAEQLYQNALKLLKQKSDETHPDYRSVLSKYGNLMVSLGRWEKAEAMLTEAFHSFRAHEGEKGMSTIISRMNLAVGLLNCGKKEKFELEMQKVLADSLEVFGIFHPQTFSSYISLASYYYEEKLTDSLNKLLPDIETILLADREEEYEYNEIIQGCIFLGESYEQSKNEEARTYFEYAYQLACEIRGQDDEWSQFLSTKLTK